MKDMLYIKKKGIHNDFLHPIVHYTVCSPYKIQNGLLIAENWTLK